MEPHDIHDFVISTHDEITEEYLRIRKRASQDPSTAGDQGEENWATLLRKWLPNYFHIVTKGRILTDSGYASPQVDILVLYPSYPKILLDKKLYLSGGVAAAFECKTTLKAADIKKAVRTSAEIRRNLPKRTGTPYRELNSPIIYGLLAHSHSWKGKKSTPLVNVEKTIIDADATYVMHPIECIDFVTISDLATWAISKMTYMSPKLHPYEESLSKVYGPNGSAATSYICCPIGDKLGVSGSDWLKDQKDYFRPLGVLLSGLFSKLAWVFSDMRNLEEYFRKTNLLGRGQGQLRLWDLSIYSSEIRERVYNGILSNGILYDEWSVGFF